MRGQFQPTGRLSVKNKVISVCSQGKEEGGSGWPAEAESACRVEGAGREGTSHDRRCTVEEDLRTREAKQH